MCSVEWDYIGKTETFLEDHDYMFAKLNLLDIVGLPRKSDKTTNSGGGKFYQYYEGLGDERILALYELYKPDFELFGYEIPPGLLTSTPVK